MKKIYAILVAALIATAFTAHADVELHHVFPTAKMTKKVKTPAAKISRHASKAPSRVAPPTILSTPRSGKNGEQAPTPTTS